MRKFLVLFIGTAPFFLFPSTVSAHAFGQTFTLSLPLWMYLYGGGIALLVSFLFIGYFMWQKNVNTYYPRIDVTEWKITQFFKGKGVVRLSRLLSIFLFMLTIISGFFGTEFAYLNFNMTFFWIIFYLGMTYFTIFFGNIWEIVNPWKILVEWLEGFTDIDAHGMREYPKRLGYSPAIVFFFCFIWLELLGDTTPFSLSIILLCYTILNFLGVFFFGKRAWFTYGELFSVYFNLLGKASLVENTSEKVYIRIPFLGLHTERARHITLLFFILFMLAATAYDGFRESVVWLTIFYDVLRPINLMLGQNAYYIIQTIGLFLAPFLFFTIYFLCILFMKVITRTNLSLATLLFAFAYSLLPIALVYNFAHYYTLLFVQGQGIIPLISDPFGWGWNLFGTAGYLIAIDVIGAEFIWNSQVAAIIIGHIAGVYLSHVVALSLFHSHKKAILSQIPMLILMIIYTVTGLWILSQPIA